MNCKLVYQIWLPQLIFQDRTSNRLFLDLGNNVEWFISWIKKSHILLGPWLFFNRRRFEADRILTKARKCKEVQGDAGRQVGLQYKLEWWKNRIMFCSLLWNLSFLNFSCVFSSLFLIFCFFLTILIFLYFFWISANLKNICF